MNVVTRTVWLWPLLAGALLLNACTASGGNSLLPLRDKLQSEADSLRWTGRSDATINYQFAASEPGFFILVPAMGFDEQSAVTEQMPPEFVQRITDHSRVFKSALMVYASPNVKSFARAPDYVVIPEQHVYHTGPGTIQVVITLGRSGDSVLMNGVAVRTAR